MVHLSWLVHADGLDAAPVRTGGTFCQEHAKAAWGHIATVPDAASSAFCRPVSDTFIWHAKSVSLQETEASYVIK